MEKEKNNQNGIINSCDGARKKMINMVSEISLAVGERNYGTLRGLVPLYLKLEEEARTFIPITEYNYVVKNNLNLLGEKLEDYRI